MKIQELEPKVYNRISAGEVVERPASVIKELVENSIDAGATEITIEIENGGITKMSVADNGCGIEKDDMFVAFKPHATSKIKTVEDLENIMSLGFRGEALASIASVCHVYLSSKARAADLGYCLKVDGGVFGSLSEVARQTGTSIICYDLFYNVPVRLKFLKKPKTEEAEVTAIVEKFMLSNPGISFKYMVDGKQVYNTKSCGMQDIIYTIYGKEVYESLIPVDYKEEGYHVVGYLTKPKISKSNRTYQTLFVNGRFVENYAISSAVQGVYESFLMKGRFPVYVLNLLIGPDCVDVNVHPSKREVKFEQPNRIFGFIRRAVEESLLSVDQIANFTYDEKQDPQFNEAELRDSRNLSGYSPEIKKKEERVSATQGSSFVRTTHFEGLKPFPDEVEIDPKDFEDVDFKKPMPNFEKYCLEKRKMPENKGGHIYFDSAEDERLVEIIINDQNKKMQQEQSLKQEQQRFITSSIQDEMKILGTVFKTYIVLELHESVYFIDQHAGHERVLYDKLLKQVNDKEVSIQDLLVPYLFKLGGKEVEYIENCLPCLEEMGFAISCSNFEYTISSVPLVLANINLSDFVDDIIADGANFEKKASDFIHEKLCQSACKHAIKGGDSISRDDCASLISQIRDGVMLCPHGRPVVLEFTKKEIEKMFGRIV